MPSKKDMQRYIMERVSIQENGCWEWTMSRTWKGYGQGHVNRKTGKAHRISYEAFIGPIPKGMHVLHECDNPPCCNPDHLWLGTNSDNIRDAVAKGRHQGNRATTYPVIQLPSKRKYGDGEGKR